MRYLSVCSGIEAASVAWHPLGWEAVGFSEIETFPAAVLAHHFPTVPNFGDLTRHAQWNLAPGTVDLVVGGTPCQSFSVAGLRAGMEDPRGNLALTFLALVNRTRPRWVLWENVPGVLSSNGGRDFGAILGALGELGYGWAYRILDAQHFGVPQRRRRVFLVGYLGDWRPPAAVLFEPESLRGDLAPRRAKGQGAARNIEGRAHGNLEIMSTLCAADNEKWGCNQWVDEGKAIVGALCARDSKGVGSQYVDEGKVIAVSTPSSVATYSTPAIGHIKADHIASTLTRNTGGGGETQNPAFVTAPMVSATVTSKWAKGSGGPAGHECQNLVAAPIPFVKAKRAQSDQDDESWEADRPAPTLSVFDSGDTRATVAVVSPPPLTVRRLTPMECERLQGFPDGWTAIPHRGKPAADGPRYKAIGNSMAVPVMRWIGERIKAYEEEP